MRPRSSMMIMASGTVCRIERNRASAASSASAIAGRSPPSSAPGIEAVQDPFHAAVGVQHRHIDHDAGRRGLAAADGKGCRTCQAVRPARAADAFEGSDQLLAGAVLLEGLPNMPADQGVAGNALDPAVGLVAGDDREIGCEGELRILRCADQMPG